MSFYMAHKTFAMKQIFKSISIGQRLLDCNFIARFFNDFSF